MEIRGAERAPQAHQTIWIWTCPVRFTAAPGASRRLTPPFLKEGVRVLKRCLSSSQAKREKMVHRWILDHSDLFNGDQERKRHSETDRYHLSEEMRRHPR